MLPFKNAGIDIHKLDAPYWLPQWERAKYPTMQQWSLWINVGKFSVMLFFRLEE